VLALALCPQDVGVILTYRCHGSCAHCIYNCGPRWKNEAMSPQMLRQALEAMAVWPQPPQVHLTGGEPFLHFDLLLEGTRIATELGIHAYLETSGAWCLDENEGLERFQALRDAGLQSVLISCSPFHAERIPPVRMLRAAHAAISVFGPHRVTVYQSQYLDLLQQFGTERPTPLVALRRRVRERRRISSSVAGVRRHLRRPRRIRSGSSGAQAPC
jgi:hypothetical protein